MRLSLLMQEAVRRIGSEIEAELGDVLPFGALAGFTEPQALMAHLRALTHALGRPRLLAAG